MSQLLLPGKVSRVVTAGQIEGEISNILDHKKNYEQDENLFAWMDVVPQPKWNMLKGAVQVIQRDEEAEKTLRIQLGRNKGVTAADRMDAACLRNNIAVSLSDEDPEKALEKYANVALRAVLEEAGVEEDKLHE